MKNKNGKKPSLKRLIQELLRAVVEKKYFGTRKKLNEELLKYVELDKDFSQKIKKLRKKYNIPELNQQEDIISFPVGDKHIEAESGWLSSQDKKTKKAIESDIHSIVKEYNLSENFFDWIEFYILYNKQPPWSPFYNWELPLQIGKDFNELERIPLTTQEKRYIKSFFRRILGIKRRPPKEKIKAYRKICQVLEKAPKNKRRPFRTLETALKTLGRGKLTEYYEPSEGIRGEDKLLKKTYDTLAIEIDEEGKYFGKEKQLSQRLRKQHQRLKERRAKIMDKKKLKK